MKRIFLIYGISFFLTVFACNSFAAPQLIKTGSYSIHLPDKMELVWKNEKNKIPVYQYRFLSKPFTKDSSQEMRITAVAAAPNSKEEYAKWEAKVMVDYFIMFNDQFHIDLTKQREVLSKPEETITLGNQSYKAMSMTQGNMKFYILVTVAENSTYPITLIVIDKDKKAREANMLKLLDSIKTIQFHGAHPTTRP